MTKLSVNLNKIALIRNSRGRDYPNVVEFAKKFIDMGVHGITIHPRPDERHATRKDASDIAKLLEIYPDVEFNIEGYPTEDFLNLVIKNKPDQCTLVPDGESQLTSDHGWDCINNLDFLKPIVTRLKNAGIRVSLFIDPDTDQIDAAAKTGAQRIELYTESYASSYGTNEQQSVFESYQKTALCATDACLGINAGHDLDLKNLSKFLEIKGILEVSIGHALVVECLEQGMDKVAAEYLKICNS